MEKYISVICLMRQLIRQVRFSSSNTNYQSQLVSLVNTYARSNACTVEFTISDSTKKTSIGIVIIHLLTLS